MHLGAQRSYQGQKLVLRNCTPKERRVWWEFKGKLWEQLWKFIATVMPTEVKTFLPNSDWSSDFKPPSISPRCALVCGFHCLCPDKGLQCFLKPFTSFGKSSLSLQIMLSLSSWLCGPQLHIFRFSIIFHISLLTLFPVFSIFFLCEFQSISFWPSY